MNNASRLRGKRTPEFDRPSSRNPKISTDLKAASHQILDEIRHQKRREVADDVITTDCVIPDPTLPSPVRGLGQYKQCVRSYLNAFPDLYLTMQHQLTEGESVVSRWTANGTHLGDG